MTSELPSQTQSSLSGQTVWLTRPRYQLAAISDALQARSARVVPLPMFEIEAVQINPSLKALLLDLDHYELVFFISTNAVKIGMDFIEQFWPQMPVGQRYFSVGPATAEALAEFGLQAIYPTTGMDSEALLAVPELKDIAGKKALIVRGVGGREILASGLRQRGVQVAYAEVYERRLPDYPADRLQALVRESSPDAIVISSGEALDNLVRLLDPLWPALRDARLFVSSPRLVEAAQSHGFHHITRMPGATDAVILDSLMTLGATDRPMEGQSP